jgi:PEP-CTERM motif
MMQGHRPIVGDSNPKSGENMLGHNWIRSGFLTLAVTLCAHTALAGDRFVGTTDGRLVDSQTQLGWSYGPRLESLPVTNALEDGSRIAKVSELFTVIPQTGGQFILPANEDDLYTFMGWFSGFTQDCLSPVEGELTCIRGWAENDSVADTYELVELAKLRVGVSQYFATISTIGTYSAAHCPLAECQAPIRAFNVREVPEPATWLLTALGLVALNFRRNPRLTRAG